MPYAFLNPDGSIKQVFAKPNPFMRLGEGERMVNYNPPAIDEEVETYEPVLPIDGLDVAFTVIPKPANVADQVWLRRKTAVVQEHLDAAARANGYDSILSAVSYVGSGHPVYDAEGTAFKTWRSECWATSFTLLQEVQAGTRPMPSDSELLAALPPLIMT